MDEKFWNPKLFLANPSKHCWCLIRATLWQNMLTVTFGRENALDGMTAPCNAEVVKSLDDSLRHLTSSRFWTRVPFSMMLGAKCQGCDPDHKLVGPDRTVNQRGVRGNSVMYPFPKCRHWIFCVWLHGYRSLFFFFSLFNYLMRVSVCQMFTIIFY